MCSTVFGLPYQKRRIYKWQTKKYTILYGRLSQEDECEGESNSIQNQRLILTAYAEDKAFENLKFMYDYGYSGRILTDLRGMKLCQ
jgi:hypothetical protein